MLKDGWYWKVHCRNGDGRLGSGDEEQGWGGDGSLRGVRALLNEIIA